ncbi:NAD(P)/FAD-dependent oxidoreductase [Rhodoferax sp.]|uniref:NAD(P)/FAD-dependent oxidoreductase n=1 Tax=Rhodoferax sp. TaxID=50421 RepID=UPI00285221FF|nr:NAD(P)/FAD-dependent oxidoreductase [Rhodoferax sp.]MDR3369461.1 NAD(P)/FAD-dependent oxidoreductase [Rhodoferax sp.]
MIETDALVIGAGPVGLFAVFELGLQGVAAQVVDVLEEAGGQCIALYPDKPIYDIPGVPVCTGRELTHKLLQQIAPFKPGMHLGQQVNALERQPDGRWLVSTTRFQQPAQQFLTHTVIIAAGVGAFVPKELRVDGFGEFLGQQAFYRFAPPAACAGKHVVIVGGEDEAVANALTLATTGPNQAKSVTLLHRRDVLQASSDQLTKLAALREAGRINFVAGQITTVHTTDGVLSSVAVTTPDDQTLYLPMDTLLICLGISPKLGPVAQWGLEMERKQLCVSVDTFATSAPGIFAVGDVITYPGKKKLIVSGFHEATLAAFAAAALIHPEASTVLQYTTSSALLQQRLGVKPMGNA